MSRLVQPPPPRFKLATADAMLAVPAGPTTKLDATTPPAARDTLSDYAERVAKYVPAEVLAFYGAAVNLIATVPESARTKRLWFYGIVLLVFWIGTPFWLAQFQGTQSVKRTNQVVGFGAFLVWAYAYPAGWFKDMAWHDPVGAGLALILFTFVSAFVRPK